LAECVFVGLQIRESALLLLLHAVMAFPSRSVDAQRAAKQAALALADARRRVRQAALDSLAALAQFLAPAALGAVLRDAANAAALRKVSAKRNFLSEDLSLKIRKCSDEELTHLNLGSLIRCRLTTAFFNIT